MRPTVYLFCLVLSSCGVGVEPPAKTAQRRIQGGAFMLGARSVDLVSGDGNTETLAPGFCHDAVDDVIYCFDERRAAHCVVQPSFLMDATEVTNEQYRHCVARGGCTEPTFSNSGDHDDYRDNPRFKNHPVVSVTWFQARDYCQWLGRRLPTEAEWELAAKGLENRRFPWHQEMEPLALASHGCAINYQGCSVQTHGDVEGSPVAVADPAYDHDSTPELVRDLGGNVREWVADNWEEWSYCASDKDPVFEQCEGDPDPDTCFDDACGASETCMLPCNRDLEDPNKRSFCQPHPPGTVLSSPRGPEIGQKRVVRGASYDVMSVCRLEASNRWTQRASSPQVNIGFRCALDLLPGGHGCFDGDRCRSGECKGGRCEPDWINATCVGTAP